MIEPDVWKPHLTVAAICEREQRFLMVRERVNGVEVINQPAGHLDPGETLLQAVVRETLEETSYEFTPQQFCGIYRYVPTHGIQQTIIRLAFSGVAGKQHQQALDEGIVCVEWMSLDDLKQTQQAHRSPMVLQCVLDYLEQPAYPLQLLSSTFQ